MSPSSKKPQEAQQVQDLTKSISSCDGYPSLKEVTKDKLLLSTLSQSTDILRLTDKHANRLISDSKYSYQVEYIKSSANIKIVPDITWAWSAL